ncbi:hypothetical protein FRC20_009668 [Serendipita sp. 405]|nr:hypothetical protein FRC20_009668 [Serendipita sp. 405]
MSNTLSSTSDAMDDVLPTNRHSGEVAAIDTPTPTTLEIVCLILGEEAPFIVTIARNQRVDDLKKAIYKEMQSPPSINPRFLALYLLNLPDDDGLLKAVGDMRPNTKPPLKATKRLSQVFPAVLKDDTVHILVRPPELGKFASSNPVFASFRIDV